MYEFLRPEKIFLGEEEVLFCDSWQFAQLVKLGNILKTIAKSNIRFQTKKKS